MANTLKTLVRVSREELDVKRRHLAVLTDKREALLMRGEQLKERFAREEECAAGAPEASYTFQEYLACVKEERAWISAAAAELDRKIAALHEEIAEQFAALKKFEIVDEAREEKREYERQRRDQGLLDEIALTAHERKKLFQEHRSE